MRDRKMFGRAATAFAAGFFVAALLSSVAVSIASYGAPNFTRIIADTVNAGFGAIGIRLASVAGLEFLASVAGGISAVWLTYRERAQTI